MLDTIIFIIINIVNSNYFSRYAAFSNRINNSASWERLPFFHKAFTRNFCELRGITGSPSGSHARMFSSSRKRNEPSF